MVKLGNGGTSNDGRKPDSHYLCQASDSNVDPESRPVGSVGSEISQHPQTKSQKIGKQTGHRGIVNPKWQVLVIDDHFDSAFTIKSLLESYSELMIETSEPKPIADFHPIQVTTYADPLLALLEF